MTITSPCPSCAHLDYKPAYCDRCQGAGVLFSTQGTMQRDGKRDAWLFEDAFGHVWRLTPTGVQGMPFTIEIVHK